ncbi:MAG: glutathione S-transferase family protein [Alphaproteobacteria bacterium]|nr:MAG: glutathione S-transferase family protein [Alphaproteobacteria bacterium]
MRLFYSPFHSFIHKSLVAAHEAGVHQQVTYVPTFPFRNTDGEDVRGQYSLAAINPLDKVPTLALDDGQVIYGSQAICEYFDSRRQAGAPLFPPMGPARFDAITRLALADTLFELTVQMVMEGWYEPERRHIEVFEWVWPKIERGLAHLDAQAEKGWAGFDIGHVGMLQMISYTDFRNKFYGEGDPVKPGFDWRKGHDALAAWYERACQRPSVTWFFNKDYAGDKSPAFFKTQVDAVLAAQGRRAS